jgi:S-(hydroxymethyl)glutathione dehydrogenase/alcohol dehydrogenase
MKTANRFRFENNGIGVLSPSQGKGKTVILGIEKDGKPICLPSIEFLFGKCVMGSLFGGIKPKTDIPILAEKCMNKVIFVCVSVFQMISIRMNSKTYAQ